MKLVLDSREQIDLFDLTTVTSLHLGRELCPHPIGSGRTHGRLNMFVIRVLLREWSLITGRGGGGATQRGGGGGGGLGVDFT